MIFLTITLLIAVGILGYLSYITIRKYNRLLIYTETYIQFISNVYFKIKTNRDAMKEVDVRGSFQADDEVGFIFKELDASVDDIYEFITQYVNRTTNDTKEDKS